MIRDDKKAAMSNGARRVTTRALAHLEQRVIGGESGQANTVIEIGLDGITVDEAIQVRVAGLSDEKVRQYAVVFEEGGEFPPVIVFRDERTDELFLADGFHRVEAAKYAGLSAIKAEVRPGGRDAAIEYAEEANLEHGFALTNRDKRHIFERRWKRGHEWRNLSDGAVARVLGVTRQTISNWRRQLEEEEAASGGKILPPEEKIGADGKVYPVARVQEANRRRAVDARRIKAAETAMLASLQVAGWHFVPRATLINSAIDEGVDEAQAEAILREIVAFHGLVVTTTGQVGSVAPLILDLLRAQGGAMEFNAMIHALDGVSAEDAERAARKLAEHGAIVLVGRGEEIWAALPDVARELEQERRRQGARPVRYVDGGEFNQDAGDEAVYGVPVVEEAPAQGSKEDFRALVELYAGWITEVLSSQGPVSLPQLQRNIVQDGDQEQLDAFAAAISDLTRGKKVINNGGYYRLARGYTPVLPPSAPQAAQEEISEEAERESAFIRTLGQFADLSVALAEQIEQVRRGYIVITPEHVEKVRGAAEDALDFWQGYTTDEGQQIVGLGALLVALLGELEGGGDGA